MEVCICLHVCCICASSFVDCFSAISTPAWQSAPFCGERRQARNAYSSHLLT
ncbi:hypothetical protein M011DRAFT_466514 [Sporormia fimetaria CBS 119925]|uniref:Uncharacterized protein n=1 Tax=Sporormia fimetaria CBS 119925 TaxID=1340428 RepID=A0A6A6VG01_9PLEO|nr:hypothetical protein M011DRAFT_466514 [Sporormia fimetaria CBS 119925]